MFGENIFALKIIYFFMTPESILCKLEMDKLAYQQDSMHSPDCISHSLSSVIITGNYLLLLLELKVVIIDLALS